MFHLGEPRTHPCRRCEKPLSAADFEFDRAMLLLGRPYCAGCLKDFSRVCHLCKRSLRRADFEAGRAVTLGEELYCEGCLEDALKTGRRASVLHPSVAERLAQKSSVIVAPGVGPVETEPPPAPGRPGAPRPPSPPEGAWESRRASVRFIPPLDCTITMRPSGLKGMLSGNSVRLWVDISEGGLRAVVEGHPVTGDHVRGKFAHPSLEGALKFRGEVRHCKPSEKYQGCTLIGVKFENPSAALQTFIRDVLGRNVAMMSLKALPSTPGPGPAQSASQARAGAPEPGSPFAKKSTAS